MPSQATQRPTTREAESRIKYQREAENKISQGENRYENRYTNSTIVYIPRHTFTWKTPRHRSLDARLLQHQREVSCSPPTQLFPFHFSAPPLLSTLLTLSRQLLSAAASPPPTPPVRIGVRGRRWQRHSQCISCDVGNVHTVRHLVPHARKVYV